MMKTDKMTEQEAIKNVTAYVYMECQNMPQQVIKALDIMKDATKEIQQYRAIGTVEELKALKEKSVAKKANYKGSGYYGGQLVLDTWICPNCGKDYEVDYEDHEYCPNCGQHIDHSSLTEDD